MLARTPQLYIPPISYPKRRNIFTDETVLHPSGALPETKARLEALPFYTHVSIGSTGVNLVAPLVSTEYYFCQALVVKGGFTSGIGLAHVINSESPDEYIQALRASGLQGNMEGIIVMCPFNETMKGDFEEKCRAAGVQINRIIEIPMASEDEAPQTDLIVNPIRRKVQILTKGQAPQSIDF